MLCYKSYLSELNILKQIQNIYQRTEFKKFYKYKTKRINILFKKLDNYYIHLYLH
jgi:hypothetical protein